jgi:serine/threonine protein kinase
MCDSVKDFQEKKTPFSVAFADGHCQMEITGTILHNIQFAGHVYQYNGGVIGRGGYGEVVEYQNVETASSQKLAVKVENAELGETSWELPIIESLTRSSCGQIKVRYVGYKPQSKQHYYIMPRVTGPLSPLSYPTEQEYLLDVDKVRAQVWCLYKTHHLIYADLKPANVLYCETDSNRRDILLGDLGSMRRDSLDQMASSFPPPELKTGQPGFIRVPPDPRHLLAWQIGCLAASRLSVTEELGYTSESDFAQAHQTVLETLGQLANENAHWYVVIGLLQLDPKLRPDIGTPLFTDKRALEVQIRNQPQPQQLPTVLFTGKEDWNALSCWAVFFIPFEVHYLIFPITDRTNEDPRSGIYNYIQSQHHGSCIDFVLQNLQTYDEPFVTSVRNKFTSQLFQYCWNNMDGNNVCNKLIGAYRMSYQMYERSPDVNQVIPNFTQLLTTYFQF